MADLSDLHVNPLSRNAHYAVSSCGRVFRVTRAKFGKPVPQEIAANVGFKGYLYVGNGSGKGLWRVSVHRCVAEAFLPNPNGLPEVAHLNGDKRDNRVENLKWVSGAENQAHRTAHGTDNRGSRHGAAKLNEALVKALREKRLSPRTVSNMTGAGYKHVRAVAQGKDWPHVNY